MNKATAAIANFNCTINGTPMLEFFSDIIYPALIDNTLYKEISKTNTKYYIADVQLIKLENGPYALIGKHIKRTILDIFPDYNNAVGFVGTHSQKPSAPDANFILLLNSHRVIYYTDKKGAPNVASFASTVKSIVYQYITNLREIELQLLEEIPRIEAKKLELTYIHEKTGSKLFMKYKYKDQYYKTLHDFSKRYLDNKFPYPEINIVAIESKKLITEAFEKLDKIKKVEFKCYKLNNEPLNADDIFANMHEILALTASNSVTNTLRSPENKEVIETALTSSEGKTDYVVEATTKDGEPIVITPINVAEKVKIKIDEFDNLVKNASIVYNQLKEKTSIKEISESNSELYKSKLNLLNSLTE